MNVIICVVMVLIVSVIVWFSIDNETDEGIDFMNTWDEKESEVTHD